MAMRKDDLRIALVTGASAGIGRATAEALRNVGFRVFGTSRRAAAERAGSTHPSRLLKSSHTWSAAAAHAGEIPV